MFSCHCSWNYDQAQGYWTLQWEHEETQESMKRKTIYSSRMKNNNWLRKLVKLKKKPEVFLGLAIKVYAVWKRWILFRLNFWSGSGIVNVPKNRKWSEHLKYSICPHKDYPVRFFSVVLQQHSYRWKNVKIHQNLYVSFDDYNTSKKTNQKINWKLKVLICKDIIRDLIVKINILQHCWSNADEERFWMRD